MRKAGAFDSIITVIKNMCNRTTMYRRFFLFFFEESLRFSFDAVVNSMRSLQSENQEQNKK